MKIPIYPIVYTFVILIVGSVIGSIICLMFVNSRQPDYSQTLEIVNRSAKIGSIAQAESNGFIGRKFLYSINWRPAERTPFIKIKIDTVTVLNAKKGYVLFRHHLNKTAHWDDSLTLREFCARVRNLDGSEFYSLPDSK